MRKAYLMLLNRFRRDQFIVSVLFAGLPGMRADTINRSLRGCITWDV